MEINIDTASRLAGLHIEKNPQLAELGEKGYEKAVNFLKGLRLILKCGGAIATSKSLQAALITSINTGKRAFHGGVDVYLPDNTPLLLSWPGTTNLNELVEKLGGRIIGDLRNDNSFILYFGHRAEEENSLEIICRGWLAGVCPPENTIEIDEAEDFTLSGVAAGSLGVALAFLKMSGEKPDACNKAVGISLWKPNEEWLSPDAQGPHVTYLPEKYWFVGLGHLGQAFVWALSLLPFSNSSKVSVILQDFDKISVSNYDTGLLSEKNNVGVKKTRVCSAWLEERGFETTILERSFDALTTPLQNDPLVLIRGLDSPKARRSVEIANFSQVIDCGIGGTRGDFDSISIYNFPECKIPITDLWPEEEASINNKNNEKAMNFLGCGHYGKAISTSFVGSFASALVLAEVVRSGYQGIKTSSTQLAIRNLIKENYVEGEGNYSTELVANGYI